MTLTPEDLDRLEALAGQADNEAQHVGSHILPAGSLRIDTGTVRELVRGYRIGQQYAAKCECGKPVVTEGSASTRIGAPTANPVPAPARVPRNSKR